MDNRCTDEDEIDTETLQARIDLSMSFAQNLVSSWVKPARKLQNRVRDMETELREYMRRPPRLGVGAPIPKFQSARDAGRLKDQLLGKSRNKRLRDEEDGKVPEDEEESRSGVIKKKARVDPFGEGDRKQEHEKTGKATKDSRPSTDATSQIETPTQVEADSIPLETNAPGGADMSVSSPTPRNTERIAGVLTGFLATIDVGGSPNSVFLSINKESKTGFQNLDAAPSTANVAITSPKALEMVNLSHTMTQMNPSRIQRSSQFVAPNQPLLNLQLPASEDRCDIDIKAELTSASPKKKRKRRKRKKHAPLDIAINDGPSQSDPTSA